MCTILGFENDECCDDDMPKLVDIECGEEYCKPQELEIINDSQKEKILPLDDDLQKEIEKIQPGFGTTGKTVLMLVEGGKEIEEYIELHGGYIRDGTLRQSHEIQMLKNELQQAKKLNTKLVEKNKSLKVKLDHCSRVHKNLNRKQQILGAKMDKIPFLKMFLSRMGDSKIAWSPECVKLATQIRFSGN